MNAKRAHYTNKIYFLEFSPVRDDGSRATLRRETLASFTSEGVAASCFIHLKDFYKTLLKENENGADLQKRFYALTLEHV